MTRFRSLFAAVCCTIVVGCATVPTVEQAALLDVTTTAVGIAQGATELNPLGPVAGSLVKLVYISGLVKRTAEGDRVVAALWTGAAANNTVFILTATPLAAVLAGLAVGYYVYTHRSHRLF
jgi:hypothetical protein